MNDRIDELRDLARALNEIPSAEQFIGHIQGTLRVALQTIADELEYLRDTKARKP
jgi:hypothetical protein